MYLQYIKEQVRLKVDSIEATRDLTRYWAHFDFDMFYVACELLTKYVKEMSVDLSWPVSHVQLVAMMGFFVHLTTKQENMG